MSDALSAEAFCPACNRDRLLLRKPKYDGFTRIGEDITCATCGHIFDAAAIPATAPKKPDIFGADDQPQKIELFQTGEAEKLCRHCRNYTVNPFRQWCALHRREVEATDTCAQFTPKPPEKPAPPPAAQPKKVRPILFLVSPSPSRFLALPPADEDECHSEPEHCHQK